LLLLFQKLTTTGKSKLRELRSGFSNRHHGSFNVIDLSQPLYEGIPIHVADPPFLFSIYRTHVQTKKFFEHGFAYSLELVTTSMHSGTHIDALSHMSKNGRVFGGLKVEQAFDRESGTCNKLGIDELQPRVIDAVLLDVAANKKCKELPESYGIDGCDLLRAAVDEGVTIERGNAVLIRTGYGKLYEEDRAKYLGPHPGLVKAGARWLASKKPFLVGSDNLSFDRIPTRSYEAHVELLVKSGIYIMKNLYLEELSRKKIFKFLLVVAPLKLKGGTGSLIRPIALA
jgi:kynurenine formamidase